MIEKFLNWATEVGFVPKIYECIEDAEKEFNTQHWEFVPFQQFQTKNWYYKGTSTLAKTDVSPEIRSREFSPYLVLFTRTLLVIGAISMLISIIKNGFSKEIIEMVLFCILLYIGSFYVVAMIIILFAVGAIGILFLLSLPFNSDLAKSWFTPKNFFGIGVVVNFICLAFSIKVYKNRYHVGQVLISNKLILVKYDKSKDAPVSISQSSY